MTKKRSGFSVPPLVSVVVCFAVIIAITLFLVNANTSAQKNAVNYSTDSGVQAAIKNLNYGNYTSTSSPMQ